MVIVLLLSVLIWAPLLYPGFIQTHSGLGAIYDTLSTGGPFSGWLPVYGARGDGPLATWLLALLAAPLGALAALKLLYILSFVVSGLGIFILARRLWDTLPALIAAGVYMALPYRLVDVYVRGALAEALLLALAPFLFLALYDAMQLPRRRTLLAVCFLTLALALLDVGLGVLAVLLALAWAVAMARPSAVWRTLASAGAGLVLALLILFPAVESMLANMAGWQEHFVYAFQLFSPTWGFGESVAGWQDGMSFQIGVIPVGLAMLALWGAFESEDAKQRRTVLTLAALAGVLSFLTLTIAAPLWQIIPLAALVAYPWQLLGLAGIPLALLAGAATHTLTPPAKPASLTVVAVLLAVTIIASFSYLAPRFMNAADIPDLSHAPLAQLGDDILLLDAQVDKTASAGGNIKLTLVWQARRQPAADYTIYAHLLNDAGAQFGQQDARPQNGDKPTNTWLRGEIVRDEIMIPVKAGAQPGTYHIAVGMYLLATLERLPVTGNDQGQVIIGPITIN